MRLAGKLDALLNLLSATADGLAATLLTDGLVMVTGGCTASCGKGQVVATAEFYSPGDGYWLSAPPMIAPRYEHTATALPDGSVLIVGGDDDNLEPESIAERWTP